MPSPGSMESSVPQRAVGANKARVLAHRAGEGDAIHQRHGAVDQDKIIGRRGVAGMAQAAQRGDAIFGSVRLRPQPNQLMQQDFAVERQVINHQALSAAQRSRNAASVLNRYSKITSTVSKSSKPSRAYKARIPRHATTSVEFSSSRSNGLRPRALA